MTADIDASARVVDSTTGESAIREYVTVHDSEIGDGCRVYERASIKKSRVDDEVDINAGTCVETAEIGPNVRIGPNCSLVGVTHELTDGGMQFRDDVFRRIVLHEGVFLGAGTTVTPGTGVGAGTVVGAGATVTRDVGPRNVVLGTPPTQRVTDIAEWKNW